MIMELVVRHLVFFRINSSFQAGKWVTNHIHNSTTPKLPAVGTKCVKHYPLSFDDNKVLKVSIGYANICSSVQDHR